MKESKVRKLPKTLAMFGMLAPLWAGAVGVGEIKLHSALNQSLDAEIPLILSPAENIADIQIRLAPPEAFEKAGIQRHYFLTNIKFETVVNKDGSAVVKLTSREAVQEPFLSFLLEVGWPQGSMYREFTVLVDPPVAYKESFAPALTAPAVSAAGQGRSAPMDAPPRPFRAAPEARSDVSAGEIIVTVRNDTLWKIAQRVSRDPSISREQMMIALFENNPGAFYKENVNALKAGAKLRMPTKDAIQRRSPQQARAEYARQNADWLGKLEPKPAPLPSSGEAAAQADGGQLKLLAPAETKVSEGKIAAATASGAGTKAELAMEVAETISQENEELRTRVENLEQQLKTLQSMLTVKDEKLAAMQGGAVPPAEQAAQPAETEKVLDADPEEEAPDLQAEAAPAEPVREAAPQPPKAEPQPIAEQPLPAPVAEEKSESPYYLFAWGIGFALVGLLAWALYRRKAAEAGGAESILTASSGYSDEPTAKEEQLVAAGTAAAPAYETGVTGESSFLSEFTPSDFQAFETDQLEVDPISEADVYLAYGRYKQAEELIRRTIESHPDRDDFKLKLLEIYYANKDRESFENYAKELQAANKRSDEAFWEKVVEMGREICPDSPVFGDVADDKPQGGKGAGRVKPSSNFDPGGDGDFGDIERKDTASGSQAPAAGPSDEGDELAEEERTLEFDLSSFEKSSADAEETLGSDDLEFDFTKSLDEKSADELGEEFDFDLNLEDRSHDLESGREDEEVEGRFAALTDMDEVETKLDLAKAYVDMSDEDSARTILQEVLEAGNEEQKREARELMEKLDQ